MPRSSILLQDLTRGGGYQTARQFRSTAHTTVILSHAASRSTVHVCSAIHRLNVAQYRTTAHCHTLLHVLPKSRTLVLHAAARTVAHCCSLPHTVTHVCGHCHTLSHTLPHTRPHALLHTTTALHCRTLLLALPHTISYRTTTLCRTSTLPQTGTLLHNALRFTTHCCTAEHC